jgi:hypothetical protein
MGIGYLNGPLTELEQQNNLNRASVTPMETLLAEQTTADGISFLIVLMTAFQIGEIDRRRNGCSLISRQAEGT